MALDVFLNHRVGPQTDCFCGRYLCDDSTRVAIHTVPVGILSFDRRADGLTSFRLFILILHVGWC